MPSQNKSVILPDRHVHYSTSPNSESNDEIRSVSKSLLLTADCSVAHCSVAHCSIAHWSIAHCSVSHGFHLLPLFYCISTNP